MMCVCMIKLIRMKKQLRERVHASSVTDLCKRYQSLTRNLNSYTNLYIPDICNILIKKSNR